MNLIERQTAKEALFNPRTEREEALAMAYRELYEEDMAAVEAVQTGLSDFFECNELGDQDTRGELAHDLRLVRKHLSGILAKAASMEEGSSGSWIVDLMADLAEDLNDSSLSLLEDCADLLDSMDKLEEVGDSSLDYNRGLFE